MIKNKTRQIFNKGFTLIDVVISVAIFTMIISGIIALTSSILVDSSRQAMTLSNSDQSRKLSFQIMQELRNANYGNDGSYPIAGADDQQLIFFSNIDSDVQVERIRYYLSNGKLYRGVVEPTGTPPTYNTANEVSRVVQNDVANGSVPIFYYYPDTYTGTGSALSQPVNYTKVKLITLNLRVYTKVAKSASDYFTIQASTAIRSLKSNIGS